MPIVKNQKKQHNVLRVVFLFIAIFILSKNSIAVEESLLSIPSQIPELEEQVGIAVSPQSPKPEEPVKITLSAFGTDLNNADITWRVNDTVVKQGKGQKTFEFTAPKLGQRAAIQVDIVPMNGSKITKNININPQNVDILWEARTYTPPFYKGKSMYTPEESIIFVGMPNIIDPGGTRANPSTVTFKWGQNNEVLGSMSGYGQNVLPYTGNLLMRGIETTLEAEYNGAVATNYLTLKPTSPQTRLYEDSPIYGILFNDEVGNVFDFGEKEERNLTAIPYFMGGESRFSSNITYDWSINYTKIDVPETQTTMTFRNVDNLEGRSLVRIANRNKDKFLQKSETNTTIDFKKVNRVFGL